jgi:hypothetical protein
MIEEILEAIYSCGKCKTKPILPILSNGLQNQAYEAGITRRRTFSHTLAKCPPALARAVRAENVERGLACREQVVRNDASMEIANQTASAHMIA